MNIGGVNPFSAVAVASGRESFTVQTSTVLEIRRLVDTYLNGVRAADGGDVVAVVGPHGIGKTHLVADIMRHIAKRAILDTTSTTIDARAGFVDLYRRLIERLGLKIITARVFHWYTEMVLDELPRSALGREIARKLANKEITVTEAVRRGAPLIADIMQQFEQQLAAELDAEEFAIVLSLLMRNGYSHAVWEWLRGEPPHQILRDRNIKTVIADEQSALAALNVIARLFGHPFVLVIDDADKLFAGDQNSDVTAEAFRKFLETCAASNVLLVLVGPPRCLHTLPPDALARVSKVLNVSPFTPDQAEEYVRRSKQSFTIEPFTSDIVHYLVEVTDGVPRSIARLCSVLHARIAAEGAKLTQLMVRDAIKGQLMFIDKEEIHRDVQRVLDSLEASYSRSHTLVDYLLSPGVAIILSDSILSVADADAVADLVALVEDTLDAKESIVVVLGHLPGARVRDLERIAKCTPLFYHRTTFMEDLSLLLRSRLRAVQQTPVDTLNAALEKITRSLRAIESRLDAINSRLDGPCHGG